ncbi:polyserase-2-like [Wyeomyia smithii]|uniref:polyserase-2-like n=1 Tax=Wyeomyia smithii TaxID=174621 RepID=UPI002467AF3C|nr:polyserase-2-like [Wyeomyia smithii]
MTSCNQLTVLLLVTLAICTIAQEIDFDDSVCGRQLVSLEGLIKGGFKSRAGEWPWHVALFHRVGHSDQFGYQCGGSLVHKYLVLTAAHCVTLRSSRKLKATSDILVKVGRFNISEEHEEQGREHAVEKIVTHWRYKPLTYENDIAILKMSVPVIFTDFVQPICLWKRDDGIVLPDIYGLTGTVVGWGLTDENKISSLLNTARMPVVSTFDCLESDRNFFGNLLYAKAFCAGFKNGTGVCNGDSGGGMYFQHFGQWYLRGVVSFSSIQNVSRICDLKQFVGFTDAGQYLDWVYENAPINQNSDPVLGHPNIHLINQGDCGKNEYAFDLQEEKKPIIQQYLWMAALRHPFQSAWYVPCNGVLINKNYILTTKCVSWNEDVAITLGDYITSQTRDCEKRNDDIYFCLDPTQSLGVSEYFQKDELILARLSSPAWIGLRSHIQAVCLPTTPEQRERVYPQYILTGWKESGNDSKYLQRQLIDTIPQQTCQMEMANRQGASNQQRNISDSIVCARNVDVKGRSPSCNDYQPGTAIQAIEEKSNRYFLYGIQTSISYCSKPELFIAVAKYVEWILDNMRP